MPIQVVAYYERWSGKLAALLARNAAVEAPPIIADKPSARDFIPIRQWARWLPQAEPGWTPAGDVGIVPLKIPAPHFIPIRQWARWLPQAEPGWTPAGDVGIVPLVDTPPSTPSILPWRRAYSLQPWLGWAEATDLAAAVVVLDTPPSLRPFPYLFVPFRLQPGLGWMLATDLATAVPPAPPTGEPEFERADWLRRLRLMGLR